MLDFIRKKEVFVTTDLKLLSKIQSILDKEKIKFTVKTVNNGTKNRKSGSFWGELGENQNFTILYYIYVEREDFAKAKSIIEYCLKTM